MLGGAGGRALALLSHAHLWTLLVDARRQTTEVAVEDVPDGIDVEDVLAESVAKDLDEDEIVVQAQSSGSRQKSWHRLSCLAREEMDSFVFPPDAIEGQWALRMPIPGTPFGNVHLLIQDIQLRRASASVKLTRHTEKTFFFQIGGNDEELANLEAWVEGVHIKMPSSKVMGGVNFMSSLEKFWGTLVGKGDHYGNHNSLRVRAKLFMSGELELNEFGNWAIVESSARHKLELKIGNGGLLMKIVNKGIKSAGGVDKLIFENVWPIIGQLLPEWFGEVLKKVPLEEGGTMTTIAKVSASCKNPGGYNDRGCPDHMVTVSGSVSNHVGFAAVHLFQALNESGYPMDEFVATYRRGQPVASGLSGAGSFEFRLEGGQADVFLDPTFEAPMHFVEVLRRAFAPNVSVHDFLPDVGALSFQGGSVMLANGSLQVPDGRLENLRLPCTGEEDGLMEVNLTLDGIVLEKEEEDDDAGWLFNEPEREPSILDRDSPLSVKFPGVDWSLGVEEGLRYHVGSGSNPADERMRISYSPDGVSKLLKSATGPSDKPPANRRSAPSTEADGVVPGEFQRPYARMPATLDVGALLKSVFLKSMAMLTVSNESAAEMSKFQVHADFGGELNIEPGFFAGLLDSSEPDYGYMHFVAAGGYGSVGGSRLGAWFGRGRREAFVRLSCGTLELYKLDGSRGATSKSKPFSTKPWVTLDLAVPEDVSVVSARRQDGKLNCMRFRKARPQGHPSTDKFFCIPGTRLEDAVDLQVRRLQDAAQRSSARPAIAWTQEGIGAVPDGTWFKKNVPWNVSTWFPEFRAAKGKEVVLTPQKQWRQAVQPGSAV